ncbi:MAG TPA: GMC oxidoreductase, partial [Lacunisphaera sp.]|nr:GMC oxidoreductase [Lacunisphaera sp.]
VYGENDGLENTPDSSPGVLLPPPKPRVSDLLVKKHARGLGVPVVAAHRAVLTKRLDFDRLPAKLHPGNAFAQKHLRAAMEGRAACFWATACGRGCAIRATYQSTTVHLPLAMASGNLDLVTNAMAREVTTGPDGKAIGVTFIDKITGREHRAAGRVVVLAASSGETVRLLLNSKSTRFPQGLANSSGLVGKYLMDTVGASFSGQIPALENLPPHNEDGAGGAHMYAPWWLYQEQHAGKLGFARGYHVEFGGGGRRLPGMDTGSGLEWLTGGSYGKKFKEDARRYYGSFVSFDGRGEMIPNADSFGELDPVVKDKWGIPVMRFHWKWSEHEIRQAAHMQQTFADIITAMGGRMRNPPQKDGAKAIANGGVIIHEVGGAIMGDDPAKSVTNQWSQTWDVPNLFLTDGAPFCSNADKNPTLTIMAQAWRAADHIVAELRKQTL